MPNRRSVLTGMTMAAGAAVVGTATYYIGRSFQPAADELAKEEALTFDLEELAQKPDPVVLVQRKPLIVIRYTADEITNDLTLTSDLRDQDARNPNLAPNALATASNRAHNGFGVFWLVCTRLGCVPNRDYGDFDQGWLCPCCAAHYDPFGRIRKGIAPYNMIIPKFTALSPTVIRMAEDQPGYFS